MLHDVPSDHYCLYWSLLHAFSTQLPLAHQAHVEAIGHLQNDHPARSFLLDLAQSMETNDLLDTIWDLDGNQRNDIPTLERSILEKAAPEDFKRGEGQTMASLLNKMRSPVTKPWGTELILTYFIPSLYDVGVRVLHVEDDGSRPGCSTFTLPVRAHAYNAAHTCTYLCACTCQQVHIHANKCTNMDMHSHIYEPRDIYPYLHCR